MVPRQRHHDDHSCDETARSRPCIRCTINQLWRTIEAQQGLIDHLLKQVDDLEIDQEVQRDKTDLLELVVFPTSFLDNNGDGPHADEN